MRLSLALISALLSFLAHAQAADIDHLSDGPPARLGQNMGAESYVPVETRRFASPKVLWINKKYFQEKGFPVPSEKEVLDAFAWGIPGASEPEGTFGVERKTFYADRYGGLGNNDNLGSGRAASAGRIQIKGIGRTPLVGHDRADHSNGLASFMDGLKEAVWGEVNQELPYGGNRVLALIDRGTDRQNLLIVREDPLRPAHYQELERPEGKLQEQDEKRVQRNLQLLIDSLPQPSADRNDESAHEKLRSGLIEYTRRVARQYAALFARKLYHGATSSSNIELSGGLIDFATQTAQPGYGKIRGILKREDPAGEVYVIERMLVHNFVSSIRKAISSELRFAIPSEDELSRQFQSEYQRGSETEFLRLTGVPERVLRQLEDLPVARELGRVLDQLARAGARQGLVRLGSTWTELNAHDFAAIVTVLASVSDRNPSDLSQAISHLVGDLELRESLAQAYHRFMLRVYGELRASGKSAESIRLLMTENARHLNRVRPELYRWKLETQNQPLLDEYMKSRDARAISERIDELIAGSLLHTGRRKTWVERMACEIGTRCADLLLRCIPSRTGL